MNYRDMTFCPANIYKRCADARDCHRPLTEEVIKAANEWWGDEKGGPPITQFASDPECFKEKKNG